MGFQILQALGAQEMQWAQALDKSDIDLKITEGVLGL